MRTISYKLDDLKKVVIPIGYEGENDHTRVIIDAGEVFKQYPAAAATLKVKPPHGTIYPVVVSREGDTVIWDVKETDCASNGTGEAQFTFTENSVIVKSMVTKININRSLVATGPAPDPIEDWLDNAEEVLDDLAAMDNIAKNAQASDIGKSLSPKTVVDGVVTEWQYVEQSGGTEDYTDLENKPSIAGVTLSGNKTLEDLGIAAADDLDNLADDVTDVKNAIHQVKDETNHEYKYADLLYYKNLLNNKKWEVGTINSSTGVDTADSASIRMIGSVPISDSVLILQLAGARNYTLYIYEYGANGYIGRKYWSYTLYGSDIKDIHLDSGVTSLRFVAYSSGGDYDKNLASVNASVCYELKEFFNYSTEYVKLNPYHGKSITTVNEEQRTGNVPQSNKQYLYKAGSFTITTDGTGYVGAEMYFLCPAIGSTLNVNATRSTGNQWVIRVLFFDDTFTQIGTQTTSNTGALQVTVPTGTRFVKITFGCCWGTALADNTQVTFSNVEVYYAVTDGFGAIESKIGSLESLETDDKTSIVNAVNEVVERQNKDIRYPTAWMFDVGHQGFYEEAPASSVASFCRARAHGYNTLECDIRLTSDGEFVICHNDYLPSDVSYKISQHTYAEIYENQNLGTYNNIVQKIMKFKELVQLAKALDMRLFVELKSTLTQQQIADLIEIAKLQGMSERVYWMADVKSTSAQYAGYFRTADPSCNLLINFNRSYSDFANFVIQGHPEKTYCYAWGGYIDDSIINTFATNGLQMVAWCVSYDYYYPELTTDELIKGEIRRVMNCGAVGMCLDKWSLTEVLQEQYENYLE